MRIAGAASTVSPDEVAEHRIPMSYDAWLSWEGSNGHSEWVDGEAIVFVPPTVRHQQITIFVAALLLFFVRLRGLGEVLVSPIEMRTAARRSREPDILFVGRDRESRITDKRVESGGDLVVEIVSDDSVHRDRITKFEEYARAGVREYWIVDARFGHEAFDAFALDDRGRFVPFATDDDGGLHSRTVEGFWVRPEWLRQDPLPDPLGCLRDIAPDA